MFLHGSFWHLIANMWSLYIFGDNIEDRLGPFRYLVFYVMCGIASGFSHFFLNFDSTVPVIGASGAIAGVMGAYFVLYPRAKILTLIPIFFIPYFIYIPAFRISRIMVRNSVHKCSSNFSRLIQHCMVGTYRRVHIWNLHSKPGLENSIRKNRPGN